MYLYLIFITLAAIPAIFERSRYFNDRVGLFLSGFFLISVFFVGLRYEVGADWLGYLRIFEYTQDNMLSVSLLRSEPGYILINWIASQLGYGIVFVNFICAIIAAFCCYKFCKIQNRPWLATFITSSYFMIVIVMGLTRQGVAVSLFMYGLTFLFAKNRIAFIAMVLLAATFHVSALVVLPLAALTKDINRFASLLLFTLFCVAVVYYVSLSEFSTIDNRYFARELSSSGVIPRFFFHMLAVALLFSFQHNMRVAQDELRVWKVIAAGLLLLFITLFFSPSTTAVDRLAFYAIPLQIFVFSNIPNAVFKSNRLIAPILVAVVLLYYAKLLFWFLFGATSDRFLPYMIAI